MEVFDVVLTRRQRDDAAGLTVTGASAVEYLVPIGHFQTRISIVGVRVGDTAEERVGTSNRFDAEHETVIPTGVECISS